MSDPIWRGCSKLAVFFWALCLCVRVFLRLGSYLKKDRSREITKSMSLRTHFTETIKSKVMKTRVLSNRSLVRSRKVTKNMGFRLVFQYRNSPNESITHASLCWELFVCFCRVFLLPSLFLINMRLIPSVMDDWVDHIWNWAPKPNKRWASSLTCLVTVRLGTHKFPA